MPTACKIIAVAIALVLALVTVAHGQVRAGAPFALKVGESAEVDGITIGFDAVADDGRCPVGLLCFWEGDAACALWAEAVGVDRARLVVHTSTYFGREATYAGRLITLVSLDPYPVYEDPPAPGSYVVGLVVTSTSLTDAEPSTWSRIKAMYQ